MMTTPLSNTYNRLHHLCRLLNSADARVASLDCLQHQDRNTQNLVQQNFRRSFTLPLMHIPRGQMGLAGAPLLHPHD
jgi:hypothetical protein